jgi:hypothetical protein
MGQRNQYHHLWHLEKEVRLGPVRLDLSARLMIHDTLFFSYNKTTSAVLSAVKTISGTELQDEFIKSN